MAREKEATVAAQHGLLMYPFCEFLLKTTCTSICNKISAVSPASTVLTGLF